MAHKASDALIIRKMLNNNLCQLEWCTETSSKGGGRVRNNIQLDIY